MTEQEKQLLIKDLCARLPYGIWLSIKDTFKHSIFPYSNVWIEPSTFQNLYDGLKESVKDKTLQKIIKERSEYLEIKPYLRPMLSMTKEEKNELKEYLDAEEVDYSGFGYIEGGTLEDYVSIIPYSLCNYVIDWLNEHYFDYRGLIEKGLALEAPEDMY